MKKILSILVSSALVTVMPISLFSCSSFNTKQENSANPNLPNNPNPPVDENVPPTEQPDPTPPATPDPLPPTEQPDPIPPVTPDPLPPTEQPDPTPPVDKPLTIEEKIFNAISLVPIGGSYNHTEIYTKDFATFSPFSSQPNKNYKNYLRINEQELKAQFGNEMNKYSDFFFSFDKYEDDRFDFNKPSSLDFEISFSKDGIAGNKKVVTINDFKVNPNWWGALDREPIRDLKTPSGAISYKGKLEKFSLNDIKVTTETNYRDLLKRTTIDDIKLNFMYQVRFGIYQIFSDNFTEINYYIKDETSTGFIAVAEGIIKDSKNNFEWAIQPHSGSPGYYGTTSVKSNDRVVYEIKYNNNFLKPTLITSIGSFGSFGHSWFWDFSDNCENLLNANNPLFIDDKLFRDNWTSIDKVYLKLNINGNNICTQSVNQWNFYNFVLKRKSI